MRLRRSVVGLVLMALVTVTLGADAYTEKQPPLTDGIRGVAFAPFRDCQSPDLKKFPALADMRQDVDLIKGMGNGLRTYSSRNGMAEAAEYAQASGLRVSAGAWLGPEKTTEGKDANRLEIESLISLAIRTPLESVIVGNEVLLRGDLTADQLAAYILEVKARLPGVRVTTAEIASIAVDPKNRAVINEIDYLMAHIYPYWDGVDIDGAAWYVAETFRATERAANKKVVIGETGWPSAGPPHGKAIPNVDNAERFLAEWIAVAQDENIDYYYFAANDEGWKQEGGVGAYWGILDSARQPKHKVTTLLADPGPAPPRPAQRGAPTGPSSYEQDAPAPDPAVKPDAFSIYDDWTVAVGTYVPSGYMGDVNDVTLDDCYRDPQAGKTAVRVAYQPNSSAKNGWAGVAWLLPGTDWGTAPGGKDLTGYTTLGFYARGERGGEKLTFFTGGVTGPYGDTAKKEEITVVLTGQWQQYAISLAGADLRRVVAAFGWAASRLDNPNGATFHLDSIRFDRSPPPRRSCIETPADAPAGTRYLLDGILLCATASPVQKYDFGVDSSEKHRTWLTTEPDSLRMTYPPGQRWGAVSLTVGNPALPGQRTGQNISSCHTLQVDLRGTIGGSMRVGMKDTTMPDDGGEKKVKVAPTGQWDTYSFRLTTFTGVNLTKVYVLAEFVFEEDDPAQTVYFRNIRLLCGDSPRPPEDGIPVRRTCKDLPAAAQGGTRYILDGTTLCPRWSPVGRYGIGVDSSEQQRQWLSTHDGGLRMAYPPGQTWGAVFITVGDPASTNRTGQNLSGCLTLLVDLRTDSGTATVDIGMKDRFMADDGSETKIPILVDSSWATRSIPLSQFTGLNLAQVYLLAEFVFAGPAAQTVYFRNLRFLC